ncbi:MAG: SDR family NAD(P)-dependent oxidoreductase [Candidatus Lokiarchaeota archaeon]|nr:SDR family NAD(P)-dependent oxidoreductase [Candidatus Lokiarchaeota archaeon]
MTLKESIITPRALITGASSGIGRELAKIFAKKGFDLVIIARRERLLNKLESNLKKSYGTDTYIISKDLASIQAADDVVAILEKNSLRVDVLVNNAGFNEFGQFDHKTRWKKELDMINLHIITTTRLTKLLLPQMIKRKFGRILNVSSISGIVPTPTTSVYAGTKAYILNFSESLNIELEGTGVSVTTLCPGFVRTELTESMSESGNFITRLILMNAEKVAKKAYKATMRGDDVSVPGWHYKFMTALARLLPRKFVGKVAGKFMGR